MIYNIGFLISHIPPLVSVVYNAAFSMNAHIQDSSVGSSLDSIKFGLGSGPYGHLLLNSDDLHSLH